MGTGGQRQRRAAVVAEFPRTGWLTAGGADHCFALQPAFPDSGSIGGLVNVAAHGLGPGLGHRHLLPRGAVGAEHLVFVVAGIAYPLMAAVATVEVLLGLIFGPLKGFFVFLLPLRAHPFKPFGEDIAAPLQRIPQVAQTTAEQVAQRPGAPCQSPETSALFVGL